MINLFRGGADQGIAPSQAAKLQCILCYFHTYFKEGAFMTSAVDESSLIRSCIGRNGVVRIERMVGGSFDEVAWESDTSLLGEFIVKDGAIEDGSSNSLHVDFANKKIGGGVLGMGSVQEEIRFVVSPELIASLMVLPDMEANEAVYIRGCEKFSVYAGYGKTFRFTGRHTDRSYNKELYVA